MEVTGELHCAAERIFLREVPVESKAGWASEPFLTCGKESETGTVLSRVLVTRQGISGFSGLMTRFVGQSPVVTANTVELGYNIIKGT
jgi:hypothetical protein